MAGGGDGRAAHRDTAAPTRASTLSPVPPNVASQAAELLPDGLISASGPNAQVQYLTGRAERILGVRREDIVGRDIREALPFQDREGNSWWELTDPWRPPFIRTGHREKLLLLPNGREVLVTARYLRGGRNQPTAAVVLAVRDAEARRRAEAEHAALISTLAHELRSPLTGVKGFSATLLRRWDRFTDDQKRLMLEAIEADADRVTRLITELLDASRIEAGRLEVHAVPVNVALAFHRHIERLVATGIPRDRLQAHVDPDAQVAWADPDRLDQVLGNPLDNCVHHGSGRITMTASPADGPQPGVDLVVHDEGPGIAEDQRELVFRRFWHGRRSASSGLGLYIVRGLVEAHGGSVAVEDSADLGTQLRVRLPSRE
jgi:signal transduction histidine kinase